MSWLESIRKLIRDVGAQHAASRVSVAEFTPRAVQTLTLARKEGDAAGLEYVGVEHLFLGLLSLGNGHVIDALGRFNLDGETIREELSKLSGNSPDERISTFMPYTPRLKRVLLTAKAKAKELNHTYTGTEHLLLAILSENEGVVAQALSNLKVGPDEIRNALLKELARPITSSGQDPKDPSTARSGD